MTDPLLDTEQLLDRTAGGDSRAAQELLTRCRPRLRRMVAVHLDQRISSRIDPSDVVQEALTEAFQRLPQYAKERAISFYPWLRQIAWQRLVKLHRRHLTAARRSVHRENIAAIPIQDSSVEQLAGQWVANGTEPAQKLVKEEMRTRVRAALDQLRPTDRELLVMRYLEHMTLKEISETLEITLAATKMRQARALERLETLLGNE